MKTKKVIWGLLITMITVSCSKDDTIIDNTQNLENTIDITSKSFPIDVDPSDSLGDEEESEYGMPFDNSFEGEDFIIKLMYNTQNEAKRKKIRSKFSTKHSSLVLVKVAEPRSEVEYWFLTYLTGMENSRGAQDLPEEDDDDPIGVDLLFEYRNILSKLEQNQALEVLRE